VAIADWSHDSKEHQADGANPIGQNTNPDELAKLLNDLFAALDQDNPTVAKPALSKLQNKIPKSLYRDIQSQLEQYNFRAAETLTLAAITNIQGNTHYN
jgi:hypothetical protein